MSVFVIIAAARLPTLQASLQVTEGDDTLSASASVGPAPRVADASITEAGDTVSVTASVSVIAVLTATESPDTVSSTAVVTQAESEVICGKGRSRARGRDR